MGKYLKIAIFTAIPVLFFAILLITVMLRGRVSKIPDGTIGNTAGNLMNGGLFCEYDGTVYFSNAYDHGALYSMNPNESDIQKLSDTSVSSINAGGNYLFYYQHDSAASDSFSSTFRTSGIYRSDRKGKHAFCLKRSFTPTMVLVDNTLFFQLYDTKLGTSLWQIDIDKENEMQIEDYAINPSSVKNGTIYFGGVKKDRYLHGLNTSSHTISTIYEGDIYNPVIQGNYIYFMDVSSNYSLCRYSLSTKEVVTLSQDRLDFFNVAGDYIYYQKSSTKEPALKRIRIDGMGEEVVAFGVYENINATSQYVYFNAYKEPVPVYHTPIYGPAIVNTFQAALAAAVQ